MKHTNQSCVRCGGKGKEPDFEATCLEMRQARARHGKTLKQVAGAMGLSIAYVSDVEWGRRKPSAGLYESFMRVVKRG